jgi:hypothetical protein
MIFEMVEFADKIELNRRYGKFAEPAPLFVIAVCAKRVSMDIKIFGPFANEAEAEYKAKELHKSENWTEVKIAEEGEMINVGT